MSDCFIGLKGMAICYNAIGKLRALCSKAHYIHRLIILQQCNSVKISSCAFLNSEILLLEETLLNGMCIQSPGVDISGRP